jgi:hypothetical protein
MQTQFKRHDKVQLLVDPDPQYIEYHTENLDDETAEEEEQTPILKGMRGEINIVLPNGQYHVLIKDKSGNELAYVVMDEENLKAVKK